MLFLTLDDINDTYQNVLLRLDLNVPSFKGVISDDTRIIRSLPTIKELLDKKAKVIILSHLGRPRGQINPVFSLEFVSHHLQQFVHCPVSFAKDCVGEIAQAAVTQAPYGSIIVLENVRFHKQEEQNDSHFAKDLASLGDVYVNDAFSCTHRAHASVVGICDYLPSYAGRALQQEVETLHCILENPQKPLMAIVGGAKVSTKINLLQNLIPHVDYLVIGGGMANTFLAAQGLEIGLSLCEDECIPTAQDILLEAESKKCKIILPIDGVVTENIVSNTNSQILPLNQISQIQKIADIGPKSLSQIFHFMNQCHTLVWNGPMGVFEIDPFHQGSVMLAHHIAHLTHTKKMISIAGGGDTLAALAKANVSDQLTYTSTAGGAFLEWLEGKQLPGIDSLQKKKEKSSFLRVGGGQEKYQGF